MTFNVRYDNPADGINAWPNRISIIEAYMKEASPDIVGMQENLYHQNEDLLNIMPGYAYVGTGREDGKRGGEFSPVFYSTHKFELLDNGQFWLSETPYTPGSIGWGAVLPRVVAWAKLKHTDSGRELFVFNTHFSHVSDQARRKSMEILSGKIKEIAGNQRVLLTGDFNIARESELYYDMLERFKDENNLQNAEMIADDTFEGEASTFNAFGRDIEPRVIDFIFVSEHFRVEKYSVDKITDGEVFISDHWPVRAQVKMK